MRLRHEIIAELRGRGLTNEQAAAVYELIEAVVREAVEEAKRGWDRNAGN